MPFVNQEATVRLTPPAELGFGPEEWLEIKSRLTVGIRRRAMQKAMQGTEFDQMLYTQALIEQIVVNWSDSTPVSPEALESLDFAIQDWIVAEFNRLATGRTEAEKNPSGSESSPTTEQAEEPSLQSLATSSSSAGSESME